MIEGNTKLLICFLMALLSASPPIAFSLKADTINATLVLTDPETIHSAGDHFTLGFFSPNATTNRYLGIWYSISPATVIWVANRDSPLTDRGGSLSLSSSGDLVLTNGDRRIIWSSNASPPSMRAAAQLLDSGNLILKDAATAALLWESFRHPVDAFIPTMRVTHNLRTGERVRINSWRAANDPSPGNFTAGLDAAGLPQIYIWKNDVVPEWRSGPWNGQILTGVTNMYSSFVDGFSLGAEEDGTYYFVMNSRRNSTNRYRLGPDGMLAEASWDATKSDWEVKWTPANYCDRYNKCGASAWCMFEKGKATCRCLKGHVPRERGEWKGGCVRREKLKCERGGGREDGFVKMSFVKVPDFMQWRPGAERDCSSTCLKNCTCVAYAYDPGIGCMFWGGDLIDVEKFEGGAGIDFYVRVSHSVIEKEKRHKLEVLILVVVFSSVAASLCLFLLASWVRKFKGKYRSSEYEEGGIVSLSEFSKEMELPSNIEKVKIEEVPLYKFAIIASATKNFDMSNRLGVGGFGPVYKGYLADGNEIAVKRLARASGQGYEEFMNEVSVISKLQHRNLVRLLGCCVERGEKMLVYEHVPNRSLDFYLFDNPQRLQDMWSQAVGYKGNSCNDKTKDVLDWQRRFNIMQGIGRGLLYLHRDSRLRIIHRDLKPSNVLLDGEWNPKISDFGMARIFGGNQDQTATAKVVGTYGYMAPEYVMGGRISEKTDVFSFGVLVLEIISGRKNTSFYNDELSLGLLGYAWKLWNEDNVEQLIDERLSDPNIREEVIRCFQIGLLCVQECPNNRPTMSLILSMLSSEISELQLPENPGFTERWSRSHAGSTTSTQAPSSSNYITHTVLEGR